MTVTLTKFPSLLPYTKRISCLRSEKDLPKCLRGLEHFRQPHGFGVLATIPFCLSVISNPAAGEFAPQYTALDFLSVLILYRRSPRLRFFLGKGVYLP